MAESKTDPAQGCGCGPLSDAQRYVLHHQGTEPPGSSVLNNEKRAGHYDCAACGQTLFHSTAKYESGSGWPSFFQAVPGAVGETIDHRHGMERVEVHCAACRGHLGHLFPDGPPPTGLRYCMNGLALHFVPDKG